MRDLNLALCHCHKTRREEVHIRVDGEDVDMHIRRNIVNFYCQSASVRVKRRKIRVRACYFVLDEEA